jgi:hypothetical protein
VRVHLEGETLSLSAAVSRVKAEPADAHVSSD